MLHSYIGRLVLLYGAMLLCILAAIFINFDDWVSKKVVSLEKQVMADCERCVLIDEFAKNGVTGVESALQSILPDNLIDYLIIREGTQVAGGLALSQEQKGKALNIPYAASAPTKAPKTHTLARNLQSGYVITGLRLDPIHVLVTKEWLNVSPASLSSTRNQQVIRQNVEGITSTVAKFALTLILLGFVFTCFIAWRIHNKLKTINETANDIIAHQDLQQRIPASNGHSEFDLLINNLNRMFAEIEAKFDAMKGLSNNIAHDLRTPLTSLKAAIERIETEHNVEEINKQIDELLETFNAILRISYIESHANELQMQTVDLKQLIHDAIELFQPLAKQNSQVLYTDIKTTYITADTNLIFQALVNLIENAVKYAGQSAKIQVQAESDQDCIVIKVTDSGQGIPENKMATITDRFVRGDGARTLPGSGLGLSMVKAIAKGHKGKFTLKNTKTGFEASILLPSK